MIVCYTAHLTTNLETIRLCLGVECAGMLEEGRPGEVFVHGRGLAGPAR